VDAIVSRSYPVLRKCWDRVRAQPAHWSQLAILSYEFSTVTSTAKKVLEAALALSTEAREELVGALSISLEPTTLSPEWQSEIARRLEEIENGEAIFYDADEHLQTLRAKHRG